MRHPWWVQSRNFETRLGNGFLAAWLFEHDRKGRGALVIGDHGHDHNATTFNKKIVLNGQQFNLLVSHNIPKQLRSVIPQPPSTQSQTLVLSSRSSVVL